MGRLLRLGTRGSLLARRQAELVRDALLAREPDLAVQLEIIATQGDRAPDVPLQQMSGGGVFARAIEEALLAGQIDCAVHSLKDLPAAERAGLELVAFPRRADARDALVCRRDAGAAPAAGLRLLRDGARVATGSPRRAAQLLHVRPDLVIVPIRGNLDTRLRKLDESDLDAVVLAVAGLERLGLGDRISMALPVAVCVPAVGQGALAVQCRADDAATRALLAPLDDAATRAAVVAERALLAALGGGCHVPIAAYGEVRGAELCLVAVVASPDGRTLLRDQLTAPPTAAPVLGMALAARLLAAGARELLRERAAPA
jgi:hydroxymethylbilane synthase